YYVVSYFFFFFQAEDGIRDRNVTGVQTCALPILEEEKDNRVFGAMDGAIRGNMFRQVQQRWMEWQKLFLSIIPFPEISAARAMRSEERRVGKECRSRWSRDH